MPSAILVELVTWLHHLTKMRHCFRKPPFSLSTLRCENSVFWINPLWRAFSKGSVFLDQKRCLSVYGRPKQGERDAVSNKNILVWTWPKSELTSWLPPSHRSSAYPWSCVKSPPASSTPQSSRSQTLCHWVKWLQTCRPVGHHRPRYQTPCWTLTGQTLKRIYKYTKRWKVTNYIYLRYCNWVVFCVYLYCLK